MRGNRKIEGAGLFSAGSAVLGVVLTLSLVVATLEFLDGSSGVIFTVSLVGLGLFLLLYGFMAQVISLLKRMAPPAPEVQPTEPQGPDYREQGYRGGVDAAIQERRRAQ